MSGLSISIVFLQEGKDFLERMGGVEEEEPADENDSGVKTVAFAEDVDTTTPERGSRPKLQRDSTMEATVKVLFACFTFEWLIPYS